MAPTAISWTRMVPLLVLVMIVARLVPQTSAGFPEPANETCSQCDCTETKMLDCKSRNLTQIPPLEGYANLVLLFFHNNSIKFVRQFPKLHNVRELVLTRNEIMEIEDSAFKNLVMLRALDLSHNLLDAESLQPQVFQGTNSTDLYDPLRYLFFLNLAHNKLRTLNPNLFEHCPQLKDLNLAGNPLSVIGSGLLDAISSVPLLSELNLANTRLKSLPENGFYHNRVLKTLDLSDNLFTEPPEALESNSRLVSLTLSGNPMTRIRRFPKLPFLVSLELSRMPKLMTIENRSLSYLPQLATFNCNDNPHLVQIDDNVFSYVNESIGEGEIWPPLTRIILRNNALRSIDNHLVGRWDRLQVIDLQHNPWLCDCDNQWMLSILTPLIAKVDRESLCEFRCGLPSEMENKSFIDLYNGNYVMRCLDLYNHKPEKDGRLLIQIVVFVIIVAALLMGAVLYYKRYVKINKLDKLNLFIQYSQLDLVPVIKKSDP